MEINLGGVLWAIVIGGLAGWVASMITGSNASMGLLANIIVGVIGAVIGNFLLPFFGISGTNGATIWSFVVALIGAVVLLFVVKLFTGRRA